MLGAAIFGGIVVLSGAYGLHASGMLNLTPQMSADMSRLLREADNRIAGLEKQIASLGQNAAGQDARQLVGVLETRLDGLESKVADVVAAPVAASGPDLEPDIATLKTDLTDLEAKVDDLSASISSGGGGSDGGNPAALAPLQDKLVALEQTVTTASEQSSSVSTSVSELQGKVGGLQTSLEDLTSRLQNAEATAKSAQSAVSMSDASLKILADSQARASETLSSLSSDLQAMVKTNATALDGIRGEISAMSARVAAVEATMGDATAREVAARALSVSALKSAVDSGRPYKTELAAVKAGLPDTTDLAALEAHADAGIAPVSVLIAEFPDVARSIYATFSEPDQSGDLLDNLLSSARSIVSVRGPGDADGTGPAAVLRRMENAVSKANLPAALAAYQDLPEPAKAVGADWAARVRARVEVDALTEKASQEVLSELARKDS